MSEHTKTPWRDDGYGGLVGPDGKTVTVWGLGIAHGQRSTETEANARYIVRCVNNHERLVECLRLAVDFINKNPADPDITKEQIEAWQRLVKANPDALLFELEAEKGCE